MTETDSFQPLVGTGNYCFFTRTNIVILSFIFLIAFALRYYYNFLSAHINDYAAGDAFEYLRNAGALSKLCEQPPNFWFDAIKCLSGSASPELADHVKQVLAPLNGLGISGPIFPAFLASCYALSFTPFNVDNWVPPVFGQCIISALTCVFIAATGTITFNRKTGIVAGIFCAIYPASIIFTGRLYTETFAAWLISLISVITVLSLIRQQKTESMLLSLANGLTLAGLQFTRSVMFALNLVLIPITLFQKGWRRGCIYLACFTIGFTLVAAPWMAFQKLAYGSASFILDRAGHFAMLNGNNTDTGGWLSFPYPDYSKVTTKPLSGIILDSFHASPTRWLKLMLQDKPIRLFGFPCNDFRKAVGCLQFPEQVYIHQIFLLLGAIGAVMSLVVPLEQNQSRPNRSITLIFLFEILLIHSIYLAVNTVARYNLTAMPFIILFAAVGTTSMFDLTKKRNGAIISGLLITSALLFYLVIRISLLPWIAVCFPHHAMDVGILLQIALRAGALALVAWCLWRAFDLQNLQNSNDALPSKTRAPRLVAGAVLGCLVIGSIPTLVIPAEATGRFGEWQAKLIPGQAINQTIVLPQGLVKTKGADQMYLLIDSDSLDSMQSLEVKLNGIELDAPRVPSIALADTFSRFQNLPNGFMRDAEWVFNCLASQVGTDNSELRQWFILPVPGGLITTNRIDIEILNAAPKTSSNRAPVVYGAYSTYRDSLSIPSLTLYSWEKAFCGVEREDQLSDTRFNTKILSAPSLASEKDMSSEPGVQSGRFNIHLFQAGPSSAASSKGPDAQTMTEIENKRIGAFTIPDIEPYWSYSLKPSETYTPDEWWLISLKAKVRRTKTRGDVEVLFKTNCTPSAMKASVNTSLNRTWGTEAPTKPDATKPYISPWGYTARNVPVSDDGWQNLDVAIPIVPGSFGAPLKDIVCNIQVSPFTTQAITDKTPLTGSTQFTDVSIKIVRLPDWPLRPGYKIY